ncbi:MAG: VPS10 domain-containing protein [Lutibacter sp.]
MKQLRLLLFIILQSFLVQAQQQRVSAVPFTNIGPSIMSGRVVSISVNPYNSTEFYVAYATGGLWHTVNNGTSFKCVTNNAPTQNLGAVTVNWATHEIWLGTGEVNSSRSSYAGIGVLKSEDDGKTWQKMGLENTHHIGKIIINKKNPKELLVAAIGHLYSTNKERGVFKTTDGGKTWNKTLFINDSTGVIDMVASPKNQNVIYAAAWERMRTAWNFKGSGVGSGIYKSVDSGTTWQLISNKKNGFPEGKGVGRIGLAVFNDNIVYALLDNQNSRPIQKKKKEEGLVKDDFKTMTKEVFFKLSDKKLNNYLKVNHFNKKYTAKNVKEGVSKNKFKISDLATYLEDANYTLLNSKVVGAELYKSENGGQSWVKVNKNFLDNVYSTYGYYFGTIAVDLNNSNKVYIGGVPLLKSSNGGQTFEAINKENVHADHHVIWVDANLAGHLINGNDGGINISFDDGQNWTKNNAPAVGQFYSVNVDSKKNFNVYGGLQDNGVWKGPNNYKPSKKWESLGKYPYDFIGGGDGMQVQIDNRDNETIYAGSQFGYYYRKNLKTNDYLDIHPTPDLGNRPYRYNWETPILLSKHNQDILYMGANKLLRSMDKGKTFSAISPDLTLGGKKGNVPFGTLTTIAESPFKFGFLYTGSDDGLIQLSEDGGSHWKIISKELPQNMWISCVVASQHQKKSVYATLNNYRNDDFKPYVYYSSDKGNTWLNIAHNLPMGSVNVIMEDPKDENLLFLGTDVGVFVSFNKGNSWEKFSEGIPIVPVHDLVIEPETSTLVVGTHGRSIYKASIEALEKYEIIKDKKLFVFEIKSLKKSKYWGSAWNKWLKPNEPKINISYYVAEAGDYLFEVYSKDKKTLLFRKKIIPKKGFNTTNYNASFEHKLGKKYFLKNEISIKQAKNKQYYLPKGTYQIKISNKNMSSYQKFEIK